MSLQKLLFVGLVAAALAPRMTADSLEKDLGNRLKARYKRVRVSVMVPGFYAGEFEKSMQARTDFVNWRHYHESLPVKREGTVLDQIDDRTFATPRLLSGNGLGSNIFPVEKGEAMLASNALFGCSRGMCTLILFLDTMKLSKTTGMDPRKESRTAVPLFESAGLGCTFTFAFAREMIERPGADDLIVATVSKYLQPSEQAGKSLKAEKNIEIDIGATEEEVIAKLGEPLKTVRVGSQKTLKYSDMTIILKEGKVADVKVE